MLQLPAPLAANYRLATAREVHSWSFGQVNAVRRPGATSWEECLGTLDDQRIFGPLRELECACGKYVGAAYRGLICDRCGVKVATREERRTRFGHIDLAVPLPHPMGDRPELVGAVPVLPATFLESRVGERLIRAYEGLLAAENSPAELRANLRCLFEMLLPALTVAHEWGLAEYSALAQGLVLARCNEGDEPGAAPGPAGM